MFDPTALVVPDLLSFWSYVKKPFNQILSVESLLLSRCPRTVAYQASHTGSRCDPIVPGHQNRADIHTATPSRIHWWSCGPEALEHCKQPISKLLQRWKVFSSTYPLLAKRFTCSTMRSCGIQTKWTCAPYCSHYIQKPKAIRTQPNSPTLTVLDSNKNWSLFLSKNSILCFSAHVWSFSNMQSNKKCSYLDGLSLLIP